MRRLNGDEGTVIELRMNVRGGFLFVKAVARRLSARWSFKEDACMTA